MGGAPLSAVLMDREDALDAARGAAKRLVDGVPDDSLSEPSVETREPLRSGVSTVRMKRK